MVAYQPGKAANMPAAATISQTSLPSHSGPMAPSAFRRPWSSRPTRPWSMPTPKSNPSSTRNPVQNTTRTMNQKLTRVMVTSVGEVEGGWRVFGWGRVGFGSKLLTGEMGHQQEVDHAQGRVEQDEHAEADDDRRDAVRRRDGVPDQLQALHDPGLAAVLGQQPAGGVHQERQHGHPDGDRQVPPGRRQLLPPEQPRPAERHQQDQD